LVTLVSGTSRAADSPTAVTPRLSSSQVAVLAASAFKKSGAPTERYVAYQPQFTQHGATCTVFFDQKGPPYIVDGNMVVVVNDRTRKACVRQVMAGAGPCT
jgi:hypothetical protein